MFHPFPLRNASHQRLQIVIHLKNTELDILFGPNSLVRVALRQVGQKQTLMVLEEDMN